MESEGVEGIEDIEDIEGVEHGYLFQENLCDRRSRMTLAKAFWTLVARLLGDRSEAFKKAFAIQDCPSTLVPSLPTYIDIVEVRRKKIRIRARAYLCIMACRSRSAAVCGLTPPWAVMADAAPSQ